MNDRPTNRPTQAMEQVGYVRIDWESSRHKKTLDALFIKGYESMWECLGQGGKTEVL